MSEITLRTIKGFDKNNEGFEFRCGTEAAYLYAVANCNEYGWLITDIFTGDLHDIEYIASAFLERQPSESLS